MLDKTGLEKVTRGYKRLKGLKGVTAGYKELQGVTRGYKGLQKVTKGLKKVRRG